MFLFSCVLIFLMFFGVRLLRGDSVNQRLMQHELASSTNGDCLGSSSASAPFSFPDHQNLSPSYLNGDGNLSCPYSMLSNLEDTNSHLDPLLPASGSVSIFPSQISFDNPEESASGSEDRFYLSRLTLQYQQMIERYDVCFSHLRDATDEVKSLLRENASLRAANEELARRLGLFVGKHSGGRASASADAALAEELRRLGLAEQPIPGESPTSVLAFQASGVGGGQHWFARPPVAEKQVSLPKSISIRSSGYLRLNQAGGSGSSSNRNCRFRTSNTSMVPSVSMINYSLCSLLLKFSIFPLYIDRFIYYAMVMSLKITILFSVAW